jgi:hypothetical protein
MFVAAPYHVPEASHPRRTRLCQFVRKSHHDLDGETAIEPFGKMEAETARTHLLRFGDSLAYDAFIGPLDTVSGSLSMKRRDKRRSCASRLSTQIGFYTRRVL